jgi:hypothetical protein
MRKKTAGSERMWANRGLRMWTFIGVVLAALIYSTVLGTQPVRAAGTCTTLQCNQAHNYVVGFCIPHGGVAAFQCPVNGETDDYFVWCNDYNYFLLNDCGSLTPS